MSEHLKKETSRDLIALGSWIFYLIVFVRALIQPYWLFVYQIVIAAIVAVILSFIITKADVYLSRGLVLVVFTSLFYKDKVFTFFAMLVFIAMIIAAYQLKRKKSFIAKGLVIGIISVLAGYYLAPVVVGWISVALQ